MYYVGTLDEETLAAMKLPRCGEMDVQTAVNMPNSPYVTLGMYSLRVYVYVCVCITYTYLYHLNIYIYIYIKP